ncbi:gamma-glutamylcyclotransferase [Pokkaliibacter plantistimulans]|uniref:glutathione-specific gamma-glutamylcyclotransferase n=1 Tax=Proteobacteria bacterium 228 TaxID=2083153 RepID=A0A2S5KRE5_9PROT|nr:gamma-glutamylcyclotransferase [Pokkaliibacter plantistimulans]PPC77338.1 gamma-glutamylcyclotransferase [Pokkaliibacter plantistimulans]
MTNPSHPHVLDRLLMESGGVEAMVARDSPGHRILTEQEREVSLQATLASRPAGDVWLFAYGSLIWNPTIHHAEKRVGTIHDWHRSFCLSVTAGRGSPSQPGLVLALDHGGSCTGVAYRLEPQLAEPELRMLWRREMVSGAYIPRWLPVADVAGNRFGHALAFTIDHAGQQYAGDLCESEIVRRLSLAAGALGSAADYLFHTCEGLRQSGIDDGELEQLACQVRRCQQGQ